MLQIAKAASVELLKISEVVEPLWVKSSHGGRSVMDHKKYHTMFPRDSDPNVFKTPNTREESSTDSMEVNMTAMKMVEALLNPKEMTELFPTMIRRAEIIKEYEHGADETRHGALLLMYIEIHHLSHLVLPRKYYFLRYCEKVNDYGIWVISDVSLNFMGANLSHLPSWKLPSGCIIHQILNTRNSVWVKWIEHVEVNGDRPQIGLPFGDLVANNIPYSAEKLIRILQRTAEKLEYSAEVPIEGMRSLLKISHRMSQRFCEILKVSSCMMNGDIRCSVRKNSGPELPIGMIAMIVNSFWLPFNFYTVFNFLTDATKRDQWDPLCVGYAPFEVASFRTGPFIGNRLSIIQPCALGQNNVLILQESSIDNFTAHIVYTPIDKNNMQSLMTSGMDSQLCILPSGFVLSGDARSVPGLLKKKTGMANPQQGGTLLTIGYQMLVSSTPSTKELKMKELGAALTICRMMFHNLTVALACSCRK